jgi:hypothetical protein
MELVRWFQYLWHQAHRIQSLRRRLATGLARSAPYGRCAPHKIGIRNPFLIGTLAGLLPWLRLRTVLRASCPSDTRRAVAMMKGHSLETSLMIRPSFASIKMPCTSIIITRARRSCSAFAWPGFAALGRIRRERRCFIRIGESFGASTCFASIRISRSVPLRVRVVSDGLPCPPASLSLDVHVSLSQFIPLLTCANDPSDSNRARFQPNWFASTANPLQAGDASC